MEFYAKSQNRLLSAREKEQLVESLQWLYGNLNLADWERAIVSHTIEKFKQEMPAEKQKTLRQHLDETVHCAKKFFEKYGMYFSEKEKKLVILACRYHDVGKANLIFQIMVNDSLREQKQQLKQERQIPHGYISALSISRKEILESNQDFDDQDFDVLITSIYYHHTRTLDFRSEDIKRYCEKYYNVYISQFLDDKTWRLKVGNQNHILFDGQSKFTKVQTEDIYLHEYFLVKGLLNKFDWTVSAGYTDSEMMPDIEEKKLVRGIEKKIGTRLRPVQQFMRNHKSDNLVIIAPTGSGKTEAALLWLNGEKGFYTLPLKVSSNAIYERIKNRYDYESVSLLHSESMPVYMKETMDEADGYEKYEKARLLSFPLTVCTVDQIFKFAYKALGTEIFAATLKYSKVIVDEIQAYSPRVVAALIYGLKVIQQMGGKFAIITATFPPVLKWFMEKYGLTEGKEYEFHDFSGDASEPRHMIQIHRASIGPDDILKISRKKKVLVICNTVTKAQEVYEKLSEYTESVYLLHSRFIRNDRELLEKEIMKFSASPDSAGIWVTTQIVEASLDIDFDVLYTEMCPADSLLQRMGRCNRAGKYIPDCPNIIIFTESSGIGSKSVYEPELYKRSLGFLKQYENCLFTEIMKTEYINQVYNPNEIQETFYYREIERYLKHFDELRPMDYDKEDADEQFRMIKSITVIPESVYLEYQDLIEVCTESMKIPHIGQEVKGILSSKLGGLTLSMNLYGKIPNGVDRITIPGTVIHRAVLKYDFDRQLGKGRGLLLDCSEDELLFI